ncbi:WD40 repeat domain-containing protein [Halomonas elongata]|uniref:WD40 repeat domain-containing protein n=1 Tax=Halomonas elongata TaxID=2746 RepID=UPI004033C320
MPQLFINNARAILATAIDDVTTTIEVSAPVNLPTSLGENDWFLLTLFADTTRYGENIEIVRVTGVSNNTLTVERGVEGAAVSHGAGERIEARPTAGTLDRIRSRVGEASLVKSNAPLDDRLRLDGMAYLKADYPDLAAMFPETLPAQEVVSGTPSLPDMGRGAAFSPDGAYLAMAHNGSPYLTIIDTSDWSVVSGTPSLPKSGWGAAFSPDGAYLAIVHEGSPCLTVIDTADWSVVSGTPSLPGTGNGVAFGSNANGTFLAAVHEGAPYLTIIDTSDWSVVSGTPSMPGEGNDVAFAPNGAYLSVAHWESPYLTIVAASDWSVANVAPTLAGMGRAIDISPISGIIAVAHNPADFNSDEARFTVIDPNDNWSVVSDAPDIQSSIADVKFSPDGAFLAIGHYGGSHLMVIDIATWSVVGGTPSLPNYGETVAWHPDGDFLAAGYLNAPNLTVTARSPDWFYLPELSSPHPSLEWRIKAQ